MILEIKDAVDTLPASVTTATLVSIVYGVIKLLDRRRGDRKDRTLERTVARSRDEILEKISPLQTKVDRLSWHLTGPDGDGGLIKDVDKLKDDVARISRAMKLEDTQPRRRAQQ